jgi:ParB family chromosome partitioning protein
MEDSMSIRTIPLSSLLPPKGNPRRTLDQAQVAALAQSIKADGVLQNLVVRPEENRFRVIAGKRRFLALQLLKKEREIDGEYRVPVEIRKGLEDGDALRLATIENVHHERMHPLDEAEAFAKLLQEGGTVEAITEKTGLSAQRVKRRVALASLSPEAKQAFQAGTISLGIAEALTVGSSKQQQSLLEAIAAGEDLEAEDVRHFLLREKPNVAMAIFPKEKYAGTFTTDLFADDETTYFDDGDQFLALQKEAVDGLAEEHRKSAAWVEVFTSYNAPWWHYREAKKKERGEAGVVIHLHPSGTVEIRVGLIKHEVKEDVVAQTAEPTTTPKPKERPMFSATLLRYVANQKSTAVQAALLRNPRKAKEVAVLLLLAGTLFRHGVRLHTHPCLTAWTENESRPLALAEVEAATTVFADLLGFSNGEGPARLGISRLLAGEGIDVEIYSRLGMLGDADLDRILLLLIILCFGQDDLETLETGQSLFNRVAADLAINIRDWWTPDVVFLGMLRRDQLLKIAEELGGSSHFTGLKTWSKTELVQALARAFAAPTPPGAANGSEPRPFGSWLPGIFRFPAQEAIGQ